MLQQKLENALRQIDEPRVRNGELESKLQMAGTRDKDSMSTTQKV